MAIEKDSFPAPATPPSRKKNKKNKKVAQKVQIF